MIIVNTSTESLKLISNSGNKLDVLLSYDSPTYLDLTLFNQPVVITTNTSHDLTQTFKWNNINSVKIDLLNIVNSGSSNHSFSLVIQRGSNVTYLCKDVVLKPKEIFQYNHTTGFKINTYFYTEPGGVGEPGAAGSVWLNGEGVPSNTLGVNGDYYLDTLTYDVYTKETGVFVLIGNIKGDDGNDGVGIPVGGTTNQVLSKVNGTDYNTQWSTLTKSSVGLGNVDNTADINKVVSTAAQTALDLKVDKVAGKVLSTEDYTTVEKSKLTGIASGATVNDTDANLKNRANHTGTQLSSTISDFQVTVSSNTDVSANTIARHTHSNLSVLNAITEAFTTSLKTAYDSTVTWITTNGTNLLNHLSNTSNPHSVTKTQVGLGNVPNLDTTAAVTNQHTHSNKALLDTYTQTEANLADAVTKKHSHTNQAALDNVSGNNTGDETTSSIQTKRPLKTVNGNSLEGSGDVEVGGTTTLTENQIAFGDSSNEITSSSSLTYDSATGFIAVVEDGSHQITVLDSTDSTLNSTLSLSSGGVDGASFISRYVFLGDQAVNANGLTINDFASKATYDNAAHDGKFGINTSTPTEALDVVGNVKISTLAGTGTRTVVADENGILVIGSVGSDSAWGDITGTLADQIDLQDALDDKYPTSNPSGYTSNSGTVTSFSFTNANGFTGSVSTSTVTPTLSLTLQNATTGQSGQLTSTDWNTFNNKQTALVSGTNIKTVNGNSLLGSGNISVGGMSWVEVTGASQTASVNTGYILNNTSLVTLTLPITAAIGDIIKVVGKGAGGWKIAQPSGDIIYFGNLTSTTGTSGYLSSTHRRDTVELVCITANTEWQIVSSIGNITVF